MLGNFIGKNATLTGAKSAVLNFHVFDVEY